MTTHHGEPPAPPASGPPSTTPSTHVTILFFPTPESAWFAHCPELDVTAVGSSIEEALAATFSAIRSREHARILPSQWRADWAEARACLTIDPRDVRRSPGELG
jgi:hypothetical protein